MTIQVTIVSLAASPFQGETVPGQIALTGSVLWGDGYFFDRERSRRARLILYVEVAKRLAGSPLTITELGVATRMNFALTRKCLDFLIENGIVDRVIEGEMASRYGLTRKGFEFLHKWEDAVRMLDRKRTRNTSLGAD